MKVDKNEEENDEINGKKFITWHHYFTKCKQISQMCPACLRACLQTGCPVSHISEEATGMRKDIEFIRYALPSSISP